MILILNDPDILKKIQAGSRVRLILTGSKQLFLGDGGGGDRSGSVAVLVVMEIVLPVMGIFAGPGGWQGP